MDRTTARRTGRVRALAVIAALGGSLLAGALPAIAGDEEAPRPVQEAVESTESLPVARGWSWV